MQEWDDYVRPLAQSGDVAWYAALDTLGLHIRSDDYVKLISVEGRRSAMYEGMKELCAIAGLAWKSPHKIRHGHGVYGVRHAKSMSDYRALSQNMMHESTATTDKYTSFLSDEVGDIIAGFTEE